MHTYFLADVAALIIRLGVGLFFLSSGYRKLFVPKTQALVESVFDKYNVPAWQRPIILWGQLLGGLGLIVGALTPWAAAGLIIILAGAIKLSVVARYNEAKPVDLTDKICTFLCTAEVQMLMGLLALVAMGAGAYSFDGWVFH